MNIQKDFKMVTAYLCPLKKKYDKLFSLLAYPKTKNSATMVRNMENRLNTVNIGKLKQTKKLYI